VRLQARTFRLFLLFIVLIQQFIVTNPFASAAVTSTLQPNSKSTSPNNGNSTGETQGKAEILDVPSVDIADPQKAIRSVETHIPKRKLKCDVLIVGGGTGGVAAALKIWQLTSGGKDQNILKRPKPLNVIVTEETDWLGGQMTAQGVPALDENYLVGSTGSTRSYQKLRESIRSFYASQVKLSEAASKDPSLNPGNCWVSDLAFEPRIALEEINSLLKPAVDEGALRIFYRCKPFRVNGGRKLGAKLRVASVDFFDFSSGETFSVRPKICLDATELGDLLPLGNVDYTTGSDSRSVTGEPHAPEKGDPDNVQDFTYPFVVELSREKHSPIAKPALYDELEKAGKFSFLGYKMYDCAKKPKSEAQDEYDECLPFWEYRRLIDACNFDDPRYKNDLAVINWESNDLRGFNIIDHPPDIQAVRLQRGKLLSLGLLYWLQTKAPRDEGGEGYPELTLRKDQLGTADGLSKVPYVRESRRIKAMRTIVEQDIAAAYHTGARASLWSDSVGIGLYPVDIHGKQEIPGAGQATKPFQIPLGSLIPLSGGNLLPASKNIGTTHITNGAYRLHPIEWAIGESQGALAAFAITSRKTPAVVYGEVVRLRKFQSLLNQTGVPVFWFEDVPTDSRFFAPIQFLSVVGIMHSKQDSLRFSPEEPILRAELAQIVALFIDGPLSKEQLAKARFIEDLPSDNASAQALKACVGAGLLKVDQKKRVRSGEFVSLKDLKEIGQMLAKERRTRKELNAFLVDPENQNPVMTDAPLTRAMVAGWLYILATSPRYLGRF
jgi:hypothetical protein